jgi:hypothetical protein
MLDTVGCRWYNCNMTTAPQRIRTVCCWCRQHGRDPAVLDNLGPVVEGDDHSHRNSPQCDEAVWARYKRKENRNET